MSFEYNSMNIKRKSDLSPIHTPIKKVKFSFSDFGKIFSSQNQCSVSQFSPPNRSVFSDRFIPLRNNNDLTTKMFLLNENPFKEEKLEQDNNPPEMELKYSKSKNYQFLLEKSLLEIPDNKTEANFQEENICQNYDLSKTVKKCKRQISLFKYKTEIRTLNNSVNKPYSHFNIQENLQLPYQKAFKYRSISRKPFRILEAPNLLDDFYLNVIDWSGTNIIAVGLSQQLFLWNGNNSEIKKIFDLPGDLIASVAWSPDNYLLGLGTSFGQTFLYDVNKEKCLISHKKENDARIGVIIWKNNNLYTCGSRDNSIITRDIRMKSNDIVLKFQGHKQEICGLKWSPDESQLASGGNDNMVYIWSPRKGEELYEAKFNKHNAAVKALAWSPHQRGVLLSGGGNHDKSIHFWNSLTLNNFNTVKTGSQVCNLLFSESVNEFVSTHGCRKNNICVWKYPEVKKIAVLEGHSSRVLYMSSNNKEGDIVTGATDQDENGALKFWNVFPKNKKVNHFTKFFESPLDLR